MWNLNRKPAILALSLSFTAAEAFVACEPAGQDTKEPAATEASAPVVRGNIDPDLVREPVLYSNARDLVYVGFLRERLLGLRSEFAEILGEPLRFQVIPYVGLDPETNKNFLKGETLTLFYQETSASVSEIQNRTDDLMARIQEAFPSLRENYSLDVYVRLPQGKTVSDLNPALREACGDNNAVRTGLKLDEYTPGEPSELFFALCDGAAKLDEAFVKEGESLERLSWRTTEQPDQE